MQAVVGKQRKLSFILLGILLLLSMVAGSSHAQPIIPISGDENYIRVAPSELNYLLEEPGTDIQQFISSTTSQPWQTTQSLLLDPPTSDRAVWLRLLVGNMNIEALARLLEIQWVNLNHITLYQRDSQGVIHSVENGLDTDPNTTYRPGPAFLLPFDLPAQTTSEILIRIETNHLLMLPIYIWEEERYGKYELSYYALYGLLFGAMLVMLFYNLFLWLFVRDKNYLLYCLYLGSTVLYILAATGIGKHSLWPNIEWLRLHAYPLFAASGFLTAAFFIINFLHLKERQNWMYYFGLTAIAYWGTEFTVNLLSFSFPPTVTNVAALVTSLGTLYLTMSLASRGDKIAITFSIAWAFLIFSTIILLLMLHGMVPQNFITQHIQSLGFLLETILISITLAQRINRERDLRAKAQKSLLQLRDESNRELELRVQERTQELQKLTARLSRTNNELQRLSITDALTGLYNRRYFDEILYKEIIRSYNNGEPLALVLADIDHFKVFNDSWGHLAGDECLRSVADVLQRCIRRELDCVARYGGEEFAIILPGLSEDAAWERAEEIRQNILRQTINIRGQEISVSMSFGVVSRVADNESTAGDMTALADKALYHAKDTGRNRVVSYSSITGRPL